MTKKIIIECTVCERKFSAQVPLFGDESSIFVGKHLVDGKECTGSNQIAKEIKDE